MPEGGKQSPATRNHSSLLSSYGVQRVQKVLRVQRVPVAASPPFWLTVFPYRQPSPREEGAPKGRIGHRRHERQRMQMEKHFCTSELFTKAPYPPLTRSPFPKGEGLGGAALCADFCKRRCPKVVTSYSKSLIPAFKLRGSTGSEGSEGSKGSGGGFAAF